jgi:predicted Rossmann fold nucleotide-binding protein DprA/Smf involved in DNA uptake
MSPNPLTPETEVTLLLCGALSTSRSGEGVAPLTAGEFAKFLAYLERQGIVLGDLLSEESQRRLARGVDERRSLQERIIPLLQRGASLAIAVERWESRGIWVLDRWHPDFPARYRDRLGDQAPPLLFGVGDAGLVTRHPTVGIVGSRDIDDDTGRFAHDAGRFAALTGVTVATGGARGADRAATSGAVEEHGSAVAVLPGDLERASTARAFREPILAGQLAMLSPYHPNARFTVGNAMGRNRLIYGLSDIVIVVNAAEGSGGTWAGAIENLRAGWVPVYARQGASVDAGNRALLEHGARPIEHSLIDDSVEFRDWLMTALSEAAQRAMPGDRPTPDPDPRQLDLFSGEPPER